MPQFVYVKKPDADRELSETELNSWECVDDSISYLEVTTDRPYSQDNNITASGEGASFKEGATAPALFDAEAERLSEEGFESPPLEDIQRDTHLQVLHRDSESQIFDSDDVFEDDVDGVVGGQGRIRRRRALFSICILIAVGLLALIIGFSQPSQKQNGEVSKSIQVDASGGTVSGSGSESDAVSSSGGGSDAVSGSGSGSDAVSSSGSASDAVSGSGSGFDQTGTNSGMGAESGAGADSESTAGIGSDGTATGTGAGGDTHGSVTGDGASEGTIGNPSQCADEVVIDKTCYTSASESVSVTFKDCEPRIKDWLAIYPFWANPLFLGEDHADWNWSCGSKSCEGSTGAGAVDLDIEMLPIGYYRVFLVTDSDTGAPYQSVASSDPFAIAFNCDK